MVEADQQFDFIICAQKAINQSSIPPQIELGVDEKKTTIVLIQNGVGNEEPFRKRFPRTTILSCVVRRAPINTSIIFTDSLFQTWVGARQPQPGVITHTKSENMQIGLYPNEARRASMETGRLEKFGALLDAGKTVFEVVSDVQVQRWEKVVWNAAWNSLTTLTLMDTHAWLSSSEDATRLTKKLMREIISVARALGLPIGYELIDKLMDKIWSMAPIGSSMRTDYENGKPMEVDIILGYPVRKGKELGIDMGTAETIYIILSAINKRLMDRTKG